MRQIEMAELMIKSHNFTSSYAKCLIAATPDEELVDPSKPKVPKGMKAEEVAAMEKELDSLEQNFLALEDAHGHTAFQLVLATGYLRRILENSAVSKFLATRYADVKAEFQKLIESTSLDRSGV